MVSGDAVIYKKGSEKTTTAAAAGESEAKAETTTSVTVDGNLVARRLSAAKDVVVDAVVRAQAAVELLLKRASDNEQLMRASQRTMAFLGTAKTRVEQATTLVREKPVSELSSLAASQALSAADAAVKAFAAEASKIPTALSSGVDSARTMATKALADATAAVETLRTRAVAYGMRKLSDFDNQHNLSTRAIDLSNMAIKQGKELDAKYQVSKTAKKCYDKALKLDQNWEISKTAVGVAAKAQSLGDSLTGQRVSPVVQYVTDLAVSSYQTGVDTLVSVKVNVERNAAAQGARQTQQH